MGYTPGEGEEITLACPLCRSSIKIIGSAGATDDVWACPYCGGNLFWLENCGAKTLREAVEELEQAIACWKQNPKYNEVELSQQLQNARSALVYHWSCRNVG